VSDGFVVWHNGHMTSGEPPSAGASTSTVDTFIGALGITAISMFSSLTGSTPHVCAALHTTSNDAVCTTEQRGDRDEATMWGWLSRGRTATMFDSRFNQPIDRPTACPFCQGKRFDTLAKTITPATLWRCRECEATWTIASRAEPTTRSRSAF
jgi:hypothetical protein